MSAVTPKDPLATLLDWAVAARYEDLPAPAVDAAKACLVNISAAILGGSGAPGAPEIVRQVREWGGRAESTVAVHGLKVPAPMAALANGVMAHAMDYDDAHQMGAGHISCPCWSAAFATTRWLDPDGPI